MHRNSGSAKRSICSPPEGKGPGELPGSGPRQLPCRAPIRWERAFQSGAKAVPSDCSGADSPRHGGFPTGRCHFAPPAISPHLSTLRGRGSLGPPRGLPRQAGRGRGASRPPPATLRGSSCRARGKRGRPLLSSRRARSADRPGWQQRSATTPDAAGEPGRQPSPGCRALTLPRSGPQLPLRESVAGRLPRPAQSPHATPRRHGSAPVPAAGSGQLGQAYLLGVAE